MRVVQKEECTSAEFQRMAPASPIAMIVQGEEKPKKGKKDKYNRLGLKEMRIISKKREIPRSYLERKKFLARRRFNEEIYINSPESPSKLYITSDNAPDIFNGVITSKEKYVMSQLNINLQKNGFRTTQGKPRCCEYARGIPWREKLGEDTYVEFCGCKYCSPGITKAIEDTAKDFGLKVESVKEIPRFENPKTAKDFLSESENKQGLERKEFGNNCVVYFVKGSQTLHIAKSDLEKPNDWFVGTTTRQPDYESGWVPNKNWKGTIKCIFRSKEDAEAAARKAAENELKMKKKGKPVLKEDIMKKSEAIRIAEARLRIAEKELGALKESELSEAKTDKIFSEEDLKHAEDNAWDVIFAPLFDGDEDFIDAIKEKGFDKAFVEDILSYAEKAANSDVSQGDIGFSTRSFLSLAFQAKFFEDPDFALETLKKDKDYYEKVSKLAEEGEE